MTVAQLLRPECAGRSMTLEVAMRLGRVHDHGDGKRQKTRRTMHCDIRRGPMIRERFERP